jgi:hypothetical protein
VVGVHAQRLADVLLMDAHQLTVDESAVISVHDDRALVGEPSDPRASHNQAGTTSRIETEMLVEIVVVETHNRWLEDVAGGRCSGWDAPATVLEEKGRLCLRPGKTELAGEFSSEPCCAVLA